MKFFFENVLLNKLRVNYPGRDTLYATGSTRGGRELFGRLKQNLPHGIICIIETDYFGNPLSKTPHEKEKDNHPTTRFVIKYTP